MNERRHIEPTFGDLPAFEDKHSGYASLPPWDEDSEPVPEALRAPFDEAGTHWEDETDPVAVDDGARDSGFMVEADEPEDGEAGVIDTDSLLARRVLAESEPALAGQVPIPVMPKAAAKPRPQPKPAVSLPPAEPEAMPVPPTSGIDSGDAATSQPLARLGAQVRAMVWYDRQLLVAAVALLAIGLIMVTSSSLAIAEKETGNSFYYALRHGFYLTLAVATAIIVMQIPINFWMRSGSYLLMAGVGMLALILVPGIGHEVNGSVRWIRLGGFTLQVSELAKLFLVVFMAGYLVRKSDEVRTQIKGFLKPLALLSLLAVLLLAEPDFGATVVIFTTAFAMMFLAGARLWQYIVIGAGGLAGLGFIAVASPYRMKRLTSFLDPWSDPYGAGYQLTQSLIAFGRGGFFGQGLGNSVQKLAYLPEAHTDFVFAVLAEELGLVGVAAVLALFAWLAWRILVVGRRALEANQPFSAYMAFGIAVWLSLQAVVNIGVASGILPTKGLTLPLVSYGGSSLIITCAAVGIVLRVDFERRLREHFGLGRRQAG